MLSAQSCFMAKVVPERFGQVFKYFQVALWARFDVLNPLSFQSFKHDNFFQGKKVSIIVPNYFRQHTTARHGIDAIAFNDFASDYTTCTMIDHIHGFV